MFVVVAATASEETNSNVDNGEIQEKKAETGDECSYYGSYHDRYEFRLATSI